MSTALHIELCHLMTLIPSVFQMIHQDGFLYLCLQIEYHLDPTPRQDLFLWGLLAGRACSAVSFSW